MYEKINRCWDFAAAAFTCFFVCESLRMGLIFEDFFSMLDTETFAPMGPRIPLSCEWKKGEHVSWIIFNTHTLSTTVVSMRKMSFHFSYPTRWKSVNHREFDLEAAAAIVLGYLLECSTHDVVCGHYEVNKRADYVCHKYNYAQQQNSLFIDCSALSRHVLFGPYRADAFNRPENTVLLRYAAPLVHHSSSAAFVPSTMLRQLSILNFDSSELRTIDLLSSRWDLLRAIHWCCSRLVQHLRSPHRHCTKRRWHPSRTSAAVMKPKRRDLMMMRLRGHWENSSTLTNASWAHDDATSDYADDENAESAGNVDDFRKSCCSWSLVRSEAWTRDECRSKSWQLSRWCWATMHAVVWNALLQFFDFHRRWWSHGMPDGQLQLTTLDADIDFSR